MVGQGKENLGAPLTSPAGDDQGSQSSRTLRAARAAAMGVAVAMRSAKLLILAATLAAELAAQLGSEFRPPAAGIFV